MPVTPYHPRKTMLCEGLVMQIGTPDTTPSDAVKIARRLVRRSNVLRGKWKVSLLGPDCRDVELTPRTKSGRISVAKGWELTTALAKEPEVADVEPSLIQPGAEPMLEQVYPPGQVSPSSGGGDVDLPCSKDPDWSLSVCDVQTAWGLTPKPEGMRFGESIVVGHPDTGYTRHPEFFDPARLLVTRGYDFEDDNKDPRDSLKGQAPSHGTSTGSVIMSDHRMQGNVVSGTAPMAQLVPLRVSTSVVHLNFTKLTRALRHAIADGHHVISMSLGGPFYSRALYRAIQDAVDRDVILLAAAGNVWPWVVYPAKYDEVIAVAACNCRKKIWKDSASGKAVDVTAPGESVWRARTPKREKFKTGRGSGTSYAVATLAGICALWLAYHGRDKLLARYGAGNLATVFKEVLIKQGVDVPSGWNNSKHGAGIVNANKLLQANLPVTARAAGMRAIHASPVADKQSRFDVLMDYFPDEDEDAMRRAFSLVLGVKPMEINMLLSNYGDELNFHIATNPEFRETLLGSASRRKPSRTSMRQSFQGNSVFRSSVSPALRERVLGR